MVLYYAIDKPLYNEYIPSINTTNFLNFFMFDRVKKYGEHRVEGNRSDHSIELGGPLS